MLRSFCCAAGATWTLSQRADDGADRRHDRERNADARDADAVGAERDQFVVRGEPAENEQDGGEQAPGNGEDERERQDVGDKGEEIFRGHVVIDEQRKELAKNVPDDQDQTEHGDREEQVHDQFAADEAVDQFHRCFC